MGRPVCRGVHKGGPWKDRRRCMPGRCHLTLTPGAIARPRLCLPRPHLPRLKLLPLPFQLPQTPQHALHLGLQGCPARRQLRHAGGGRGVGRWHWVQRDKEGKAPSHAMHVLSCMRQRAPPLTPPLSTHRCWVACSCALVPDSCCSRRDASATASSRDDRSSLTWGRRWGRGVDGPVSGSAFERCKRSSLSRKVAHGVEPLVEPAATAPRATRLGLRGDELRFGRQPGVPEAVVGVGERPEPLLRLLQAALLGGGQRLEVAHLLGEGGWGTVMCVRVHGVCVVCVGALCKRVSTGGIVCVSEVRRCVAG